MADADDAKDAAWRSLVDATENVEEILGMLADELLIQSDAEAENGDDERAEQLLQARLHVRRALFSLKKS